MRASEPAPELLQEDGGALGGPQQQNGVDVGQVETLVEQVGSEEDVELGVAQIAAVPRRAPPAGSSR